MHYLAATFLIPIGGDLNPLEIVFNIHLPFCVVVVYTAVGGLKATFLTDFVHTTIAIILLIYFTLSVLTNEHIGGAGGLYDKVKALDVYVDGNYNGSLLSFKSRSSIIWGVILRLGNLALVTMVLLSSLANFDITC